MKITNKGITQTANGANVEIFVEREYGKYNNFPYTIEFSSSEIEGLSEDEIVTKAWLKARPLAIQIFNRVWECKVDEDAEEGAVEPSSEAINTVGFDIIPSRTVKTEVFAPAEVILGSTASVIVKMIDQYGEAKSNSHAIDTSQLGSITMLGETIRIIEQPAPQPSEVDVLREQIAQLQNTLDGLLTVVIPTLLGGM